MKRRDFLQYASTLATGTFLSSSLFSTIFISSAQGQQIPVDGLYRLLNPNEALVLVPRDRQFNNYQAAFNKRTMQTPSVRVMCGTASAVAICVQWAKDHQVPLAMRSGGHSYEGFSQTNGLVIDTRPMKDILLSSARDTFSVGAGANLGSIYNTLAPQGLIIPAGSCPTVGVTGHVTGGGYGLLARPLGLACDSLIGVELVTAQGEIIAANANENADLFWACRGGGGGSFGVITKLHFRTHQVKNAVVFGLGWKVKPNVAAHLMKTWQQWAPNSPAEITSLMKFGKDVDGLIKVRCIGQSLGSEAYLQHELKNLTSIATPATSSIKSLTMMQAIQHFGGAETTEPSVFMKGKSDYIKKEIMSDEGIHAFLEKIPTAIAVIFDSYGGAIQKISADATAFAHREETLSSLQYYTEWSKPELTQSRLSTMQSFHQAMRPYMSGSAYVNYCDLDIQNWAQAYWGDNLTQLQEVKSKWDPENFFHHAQSIPLR